MTNNQSKKKDLSALLLTAVIDDKFCAHLLEAPEVAIIAFDLTEEERDFIVSIRADTFQEFADQIDAFLDHVDPIQAIIDSAEQARVSPDKSLAKEVLLDPHGIALSNVGTSETGSGYILPNPKSKHSQDLAS